MEQMSTTSSGVDLGTKFQKLAAEYSKLRAQIPVLKNAVVDERAKSAALEEEVRGKDQLVRTLTAESESLTFRNQQLTKRVEYLQERLDDVSGNGSSPARFFRKPSLSAKHGRSALSQSISHDHIVGGSAGDPAKRALEEELKRKLEENERLNKQIFEVENAHQNEIAAMKNCIRLLETEAESSRHELRNIKDRQEAVLAELRSEKAQLRKEADDARLELSRVRRDCEVNASARAELAAELDGAERLVSERVLLDDGGRVKWSRLNAPLWGADSRSEFFRALCALQPFVTQTSTHLGLFHSYWKQRAQLYPCDTNLGESMSEANDKLCALVREKANACRAIESAFQSFLDKCSTEDGFAGLSWDGVSSIFEACGDYDRFLSDSVPLMRKATDEECAVGWCNARLEKENRSFLNAYEHFASAVHELFVALRSSTETDLRSRSIGEGPAVFSSLSLENLNEAVKGLCDQYSLKIINEHQLPVATRQLRTTNECIAAALNSASKYVGELARTFGEWRPIALRCSRELQQRRAEWAAWRKRAIDYRRSIAAISIEESDSVGKKGAPTSISASASWCDAESYESEWKARLEDTRKSLGALEREKEKWMLETQLLKMKLEQCQQQQRRASAADHAPVSRDDGRSDDSAYVEEYYGNRVAELSSQLQEASSRIVFFQSECQNLLKAVQSYQKQREKSNGDLRASSQRVASLRDELETTRKGYEMQLSTLSEHLAQMNQKLTKQTDEIDMLRQAMKDKMQKKNRFK